MGPLTRTLTGRLLRSRIDGRLLRDRSSSERGQELEVHPTLADLSTGMS